MMMVSHRMKSTWIYGHSGIALVTMWQIAFAVGFHKILTIDSPIYQLSHLSMPIFCTGYANCTHARGLNLQQNKYISLNSIRESQPTGYLLKLQLFIRGDSDCHIILSPNNTSAMGTKYDIGKSVILQIYIWHFSRYILSFWWRSFQWLVAIKTGRRTCGRLECWRWRKQLMSCRCLFQLNSIFRFQRVNFWK